MWSALDRPAIVYRATSKASGKRYVGVTGKSLEQRKYQHGYQAIKARKPHAFAQAIRKYGVDGFDWEVISSHARMRDAIREEMRLIREARPEYNATMGGQAGHHVMSPKERRRISELHRGNTYRLGKTHTPEVRERLREAGLRDKDKWLARSHLGPAASAKRVICLNDGRTYASASAAARAYGVAKGSVIEICNHSNVRFQVGGYVFRYEGDEHGGAVEAQNIVGRVSRANTSGVVGVCPFVRKAGEPTGQWCATARIIGQRRRKYLGLFDTIDDACAAVKAAEAAANV